VDKISEKKESAKCHKNNEEEVMIIDTGLAKKIHAAIVPEGKEFDICKVTEILTSYLASLHKATKDRFENKNYFWHSNDFQRIIKDRAFCQRLILNLLSQLDNQINASLESLIKWMRHRERELKVKRERHEARKNPEPDVPECKKLP